ncbi:Rho guanyl-nucleotide exchange factor [Mycena chlorophos]|uniref:Rho guanyl-nucleotide exchange factor n=1 Tax=Mycena chlorophos TaxID=658473 RepID=A0A8H6RXL5_MYCCL|nr:Rho guanyl-nucleotide exchange factor [Mycena chlorophos]
MGKHILLHMSGLTEPTALPGKATTLRRRRERLHKRQRAYAVVEKIGDIFKFLDAIPYFEPFVSYGAHQLYDKYEFEKEKSSHPEFAAFVEVDYVDILEDYQLLIVLSGQFLLPYSSAFRRTSSLHFPLGALDAKDPTAGHKRMKGIGRIAAHTSFFKAGFCLGRVLVCMVKSTHLSSALKALEPIEHNVRGLAKPPFKKLLQGGNDTLQPFTCQPVLIQVFQKFYIPVESTSIHYLTTRLCVGCSKGFEIVDFESLETGFAGPWRRVARVCANFGVPRFTEQGRELSDKELDSRSPGMVKNVIFLVAKTRELNPKLEVLLCLLGNYARDALRANSHARRPPSQLRIGGVLHSGSFAMNLDAIFRQNPHLERHPGGLNIFRMQHFDRLGPSQGKAMLEPGSCDLEYCCQCQTGSGNTFLSALAPSHILGWPIANDSQDAPHWLG